MNLFSGNDLENILPTDGEVYYYGKVMDANAAAHYYQTLLQTIAWKHDEAVIMGKHITTARKVAWYGDKEYLYTYSKVTKKALLFTPELTELCALAAKLTGETYNSCLLNLYHTGTEGMAWHSDGEKMLKPNGAIASFSFGAERKFSFKHKQTGISISVWLEHGSLLVMQGATQSYWLHRLPPTTKVKAPRINLTFRTIVVQNT